MARNRTKQGARKHRLKLKDKEGKVIKDKRGNPVTVGVMHPAPNRWDLIERHRKEAEMWAEVRAERDAKRRIEEEEAARELIGV